MSSFFDVVGKVMEQHNKQFSWKHPSQGQRDPDASNKPSIATDAMDTKDPLIKFGDTISLYIDISADISGILSSDTAHNNSSSNDITNGNSANDAEIEEKVFTAAVPSSQQQQQQQKKQHSDYENSASLSQQQQQQNQEDIESQHHESDATYGFLSASGIVEQRCGVSMAVASADGTNVKIDNFKECLFVVHTVNQYSAAKQLRKALDQYDLESFDFRNGKAYRKGGGNDNDVPTNSMETVIGNLAQHDSNFKLGGQDNASMLRPSASMLKSKQEVSISEEIRLRLMQLALRVETEQQNNQLEAERSIGRYVQYGQVIQLRHVKSDCFLTVARESAEMQKDCMKLVLDESGSSASYFALQPFFRFKREGERVRLGDRIRVWSRKFNQHLHVSPLKFPHDGKHEVNMSTSRGRSTQWRIRLYNNAADSMNRDVLKAGDIVRLYHKELEGYLSVMSTRVRDTVHIVRRYGGPTMTEAVKKITGNMWEIENEDPSQGGMVMWTRGYRLKNLATGKYLCAIPMSDTGSTTQHDTYTDVDEITSVANSSAAEWHAQSDAGSDTISDSDLSSIGDISSTSSSASARNLAILKDKLRNPKKHFKALIDSSRRSHMDESSMKDTSAKGRWRFLRKHLPQINTPNPQRLRQQFFESQSSQSQQSETVSVLDFLTSNMKCALSVTDSHDQATIFCLYSMTDSHGPVSYDSYFRIKHRDSSTWIHGSRRQHIYNAFGGDKKTFKIPTLANLILNINKVESIPFMNDEDVFSMTIAPDEEINDLLHVQALTPVLSDFERRLADREPITQEKINIVTQTLTNLILFCTDSKEKNPFKREGIPYENRQRVLRERHTIDTLMRIIQLPFENGYTTFDSLRQSRNKQLHRLVRLCYRLIKQICKNNKSNGAYMVQHLGILQSHLEYSLSEEALLEILDQNMELLSQISSDQIRFFIDLVKKERSPQSIEFLSTICSCDDKPVVKNQDMICSLLLEDSESRKVLVLPKLNSERKIVLSIESDDDVDLVSYVRNATLARKANPLPQLNSPTRRHMSSTRNNAPFVLLFFQQTIVLMSRLCLGRNQKAIAVIKRMMSYELVMAAIKSEELPSKMRSAFCDLLLHCYIDDVPLEKRPVLNLTIKWNEVGSQIKAARMRSFKDLMFFMRKYFTRNQILDIKFVSKNLFLLTLVRLCRFLFEFNVYQDIREIGAIIDPLFQILDGRTDQMGGLPIQNSVRYGESEANLIIIKIKLEVCRIMSLIMSIRTSRRLTKFMIYYKHQYTNIENALLSKKDDPQRIRVMRELFNDGRFLRLSSLDDILLDLTRYENNELATTALNLLFRSNMQKEELASILPSVELLISPSMIKSYDLLNKIASRMRRLLRYRMTDRDLARMKKMRDMVVADVRHNGHRSQRLLRNLGVNALCVSTLERSFSKRTIEHEVHEICVSLLCEFVRDNADNQKLLFSQLELFLKLLSQRKVDTSILLFEIVKGNRTLCPMVEEKQIRTYVDIIVEHGLQAHYLHFLRALLIVNGQQIKRNQILVTSELIDRREDVIVLFSKRHELMERNRLIMMQDHILNKNGKLNYYTNMLYLLTDCAEGRVDVAEVKLQALLTVNEIVDQLLDPHTVAAIRDPLLKYLDEVFINTEKHNTQIVSSEKIWSLFLKMNREMDAFIRGHTVVTADQIFSTDALIDIVGSQMEVQDSTFVSPAPGSDVGSGSHKESSSQQKPGWAAARGFIERMKKRSDGSAGDVTSSSSSSDNALILQSVLKQPIFISDRYLFGLVVPFIQHFFQRHFSVVDDVSAEKRELIADMVNNIIKIFGKTANPHYRQIIVKCIREMAATTLPSAVIALCRQFLHNVSDISEVSISLTPQITSLEEEDEAICSDYMLFVRDVQKKLLDMSDFAQVAQKYQDSPQAILRTLINILRQNLMLGYTEERVMVSVNSLRMLLEMLNISETSEDRTSMLDKMLAANVCEAVLELLHSPENEIVKCSLQLGIALLEGADMKAVQDRMIRTMKQNKEGRFLSALRDRIRRAFAEIKERRSFFKRKKERLNALREAHRTRSSDLSADIATLEHEEFIETGNIQYVLRFLQLLCEGHNLELQDYLRAQPENAISVNLISETLQYVFSIEKYINESNVDIAIQAFDTLTEYVQGPCSGNQLVVGNAKLFFAVNEILQIDLNKYDDMDRVSYVKMLELKYKITLTLISLLEGTDNTKTICDLMKSTLSISTLLKNMRDAAELCTNKKGTQTLQIINKQLNNPNLFNPDEPLPSAASIYEQVKYRSEQLGINIYFLINQLIDNEQLDKVRTVESMLRDAIAAAPSNLFAVFERKTGRIEVLRDEKIERVYFEIPAECRALSSKAKDEFVKNCPRDSAQSKVRALYEQVNAFRVEMEHHTQQTNDPIWGRLYTTIQNNWTRFKFLGFMFSLFINIVVLLFYRNQINTVDGPIPIPGESDIEEMEMLGQYSYNWVWLIMQIMGSLQLVITVLLFLTYCWFVLFLNIKIRFADQLGKRGKWEELPSGPRFWLQCFRNLLREQYFFFILIYLNISILGLTISPLLYSLHLLEVVVRFPLLYDVIRAVQDNFKPMLVTGVFMVFCLFGFSNLYFLFFADDFVLDFDDGRERLRLCDTSVTCFFTIFTFSRSEGYWEDTDVGGGGDSVPRYIIDMLFFFIIAMALSQMVFGIVLDAFADLRYAAEERNYLIKNRCFVCDIERARFEARANEGITFEKHIHEDHLMWNYVYFLVYLYKKEVTELTGTEQYLWNLTERDDISFFPMLRSAVLEMEDK